MRTASALAVLGLAACGGGTGDGPDAVQADAELGTVRVTGVVRYEDRAPQVSGSLAAPMPRPARGVAVALVTLGGDTLAEGTTADDGTFDLATVAVVPYGDSIHILAATVSDAPGRAVSVERPDGNIHGFGSPGFEAGADVNVEVLVSESSGEAGAFNVFDQLLLAVDYVDSLGIAPAPLSAVWARGSNDGTYYSGTIHLLGAASDDDGYDDQVILHEAGHWAEDTIGRSDSPGGFHDGSPTDANLAWSEGFATYFSMAATGAPLYIDTNAAGGWSYNGDTTVTRMPNGGAAGPAGDVSEDMVTEILWDLGDAAPDDDTFTGTHVAVVSVQPDYLRTGTLRGIGEAGVDLWDFLDGFFITDGLAHCAAVTEIVTTDHDFPYDFDGPGGTCP